MRRLARLFTASAAAATVLLTGAVATAGADSSPETAALPGKQLTGYWQNFVNDATPLRVADVPDSYDLLVLAFAEADPAQPGAVTFGVDPELADALGGYSDDELKSDIAAKQSEGDSVVLSIGGELGNVDLSSPENVTRFVDSFAAIADEYGIQGLDVDLEHGFDVPNMASAIEQLRERMGEDFLLTMAPQTLDVQPGGTYLELIEQVGDLITVVHTQYYNSGSMNGCDGQVVTQGTVDFITGQACILLEQLRPDQVSLGLPATSNAAGSGYVSPDVVTAALDCLTSGENCGSYVPAEPSPELSGVMTWSINWDVSDGESFSGPVRSHLDSLG
ncbi:chitinase [Prauserella cavernicola]|uniref:Chitinase n=1 Tax=Prauserella cavernicola TaxID=2800127 RepID=A0A934QN13_9PSEU|nr:chitinase [Prauserella cavernicola]MBK1782778.1 chitinase [Prauserella cavernicola]